MYKIDPKFFNQDDSVNFDTACAAGRLERSQMARRAVDYIWQKFTGTAKSGSRQFKAIAESQTSGTLKNS